MRENISNPTNTERNAMNVLILESGEGEYGLSLDGSPNPEAAHYARCVDRAQAERLKVILNNPDDLTVIARYFQRDDELNCPSWGRLASGHYGACGKCTNCRIREVV
jgi:hypothetical protein